MAKAGFESVQLRQFIETVEGRNIITTPGIDATIASPLHIGCTNATAINIGHTGLSIYAYGSLFINSVLDTVTTGPIYLGGNATSILPQKDVIFGLNDTRWKHGYFTNLHSNWFDTTKGAQLKINVDTITTTCGLHHIDGTGNLTLNTINPVNIPLNSNVELILIADNANILFGKKMGNIKSSGSIVKDTAHKFIWDGSFWYSVG